jgi:hypothetical protein
LQSALDQVTLLRAERDDALTQIEVQRGTFRATAKASKQDGLQFQAHFNAQTHTLRETESWAERALEKVRHR